MLIVRDHPERALRKVTAMTPAQKLHRYFFRHMVAEHDAQWRKVRSTPMILTWREARYYWRAAATLSTATRTAVAP